VCKLTGVTLNQGYPFFSASYIENITRTYAAFRLRVHRVILKILLALMQPLGCLVNYDFLREYLHFAYKMSNKSANIDLCQFIPTYHLL